MEPFTPEEFEQGILQPTQSFLIAELITKVLLRKASKRRAVPIGEGYQFDVWHEMLTKQISQWHKTYERYEKVIKKEDEEGALKISTAHNIICRLFEDLGHNPFVIDETEPKTGAEAQSVGAG
jgi:hypothetical protein